MIIYDFFILNLFVLFLNYFKLLIKLLSKIKTKKKGGIEKSKKSVSKLNATLPCFVNFKLKVLIYRIKF